MSHARRRPGGSRRRGVAQVTAVLLVAALSACATGSPNPTDPDLTGPDPTDPESTGTGPTGRARGTVVVAVGDIACPADDEVTATRCRHDDVARLARTLEPEAVLALGDLQYLTGSREAFEESFLPAWGDLLPITFPVPGNHEARDPGARGFREALAGRLPGGRTSYQARLGSWTAYAVDSTCSPPACRALERRLAAMMAADRARCALMFLHHPRFSTGEHGPAAVAEPFYRLAAAHGVELVLSGHDHHYERFAPLDADGRPDPDGPVQMVSGAGGRSHYDADGDATGSQVVVDDLFGVVRLDLADDRWTSAFHGVDGTVVDEASGGCHGPVR